MLLTDVHRSARRFFSIVLGQDDAARGAQDDERWTVRLEQRLDSEDDQRRDVAFVEVATPMQTLFARAAAPSGDIQRGVSIAATVLPRAAETPQEATVRASYLAELLGSAFELGLVAPDPDFPDVMVGFSNPMTLPLWDYAGVPVVGKGRAGPERPVAFADVHDLSARPIPDDQDDRLYSVVCSIRLSWWTRGRATPYGPPAVGGIVPTIDPPLRA